MGVPVHSRVRRWSYICWLSVVHRKKEYMSWETHTGRLVYNIHRKKEYTSWETLMGRLLYNVLFKKSDCKITQHCMRMGFETYRGHSHWMRQMIVQLTFKACNTDPYVCFTLLHAVVRWKGLVDRVRVPCVMCLLPPGVVHGTKLDMLCRDFALLVVLDLCFYHGSPSSR